MAAETIPPSFVSFLSFFYRPELEAVQPAWVEDFWERNVSGTAANFILTTIEA